MSKDKKRNHKPAHEIRLGQIRATIWGNNAKNKANTPSYGVTLSKRYFDDDDEEWKTSNSFRIDELVIVGKLVEMAQSWIFEKMLADTSDPEEEQEDAGEE